MGDIPVINIFTTTFSRWPAEYGMSLVKRRAWNSPNDDEGAIDDQDTDTAPGKGGDKPDDKSQPDTGDDDSNNPTWLAKRLERAENKAKAELLQALGYENQDDLTAALEELTKHKREQMSASEKLQADLIAAQQLAASKDDEIAKRDQKIQEMTAARTLNELNAAIRLAAIEANAAHPEDVVAKAHADNLVDIGKLVDANGAVNAEPVGEIITKLRDSRPEWFRRQAPGSPSTSSGRSSDLDAKQRSAARREASRMYRRGL